MTEPAAVAAARSKVWIHRAAQVPSWLGAAAFVAYIWFGPLVALWGTIERGLVLSTWLIVTQAPAYALLSRWRPEITAWNDWWGFVAKPADEESAILRRALDLSPGAADLVFAIRARRASLAVDEQRRLGEAIRRLDQLVAEKDAPNALAALAELAGDQSNAR